MSFDDPMPLDPPGEPPFVGRLTYGLQRYDPGRTLGVVGLVLGFFGTVFALAGLVLSLLGLRRSRRVGITNVPAVVGLVVSSMTFVGSVVAVGGLAVWASREGGGDAVAGARALAGEPAFCASYADLSRDVADLQRAADGSAAYVAAVRATAKDLRDASPPAAVAPDWATLVSFFEVLDAPLRGVDASDAAAVSRALAPVRAEVRSGVPGVTAAGDRVDAYAAASCR